jgi:GDP-4-dehydro-6-deoxy-D-mannose reductase
MNRVLVTGAYSFTAGHLLPVLVAKYGGDAVVGSDVQVLGNAGYRVLPADLSRRESAERLVAEAAPTQVVHLAGVSSPDPDRCFRVNLDGTRHLLAALAARPARPRVLFVSSAAVYGLTDPEESPVRESTPYRPLTPYGASKAAAEIAALTLHRREGLPVTVVRPFNLIGPGLPAGLAPADFAAQVRDIRDGRAAPVLRTGNLTPRRDFLDVRDAARAYLGLLEAPEAIGRVYNLGTGEPTAIRTVLDLLLRLAGVSAAIETDPARVRAVDVEEQVADVSALRALLDWSPRIPLVDSLEAMLRA